MLLLPEPHDLSGLMQEITKIAGGVTLLAPGAGDASRWTGLWQGNGLVPDTIVPVLVVCDAGILHSVVRKVAELLDQKRVLVLSGPDAQIFDFCE